VWLPHFCCLSCSHKLLSCLTSGETSSLPQSLFSHDSQQGLSNPSIAMLTRRACFPVRTRTSTRPCAVQPAIQAPVATAAPVRSFRSESVNGPTPSISTAPTRIHTSWESVSSASKQAVADLLAGGGRLRLTTATSISVGWQTRAMRTTGMLCQQSR